MNRFLYFAGFTYIALCGAILFREAAARRAASSAAYVATTHSEPGPPPPSGTSGERWFSAVKPFCNPVEVDVRVRFSPPPSTSEGAGYAAACFALAGKIDRARTVIDAMSAGDRGAAASVLFNVAHPVADAGDDRAAGPMMALVLDYWPNNYMALYHAGMSEFSLGQTALAETHLRSFLRMYDAADGFTANARQALETIARTGSGAVAEPRKSVERDSPPRP
jgi:hypothetical protein